MADFANWVCAAAPALPFTSQRFLEAYQINRAESVFVTLESSALGSAIQSLVAEDPWEGTYTQLLDHLNSKVAEATKKSKAWPKNARALSGGLRKIGPVLRADGITISELAKDSNGHLRIALNSSALGPGNYQFTIEGLTWKGDAEPDSWITIGIQR